MLFEIGLACECTKLAGTTCVAGFCKASGIAYLVKGSLATLGSVGAIEAVNQTVKVFPNSPYLRRLSWSAQWVKKLPLTILKGTYETLTDKSTNYYFYQYTNGTKPAAFVTPILITSASPAVLGASLAVLVISGIGIYIYKKQDKEIESLG
jgi:hypothetical protein